MTDGFLNLLSQLTLSKVTNWAKGGSDEEDWTSDEREDATVLDGANAATSKRKPRPFQSGEYHAVLLDLDIPAYLIPSSTPGHSHLYIDTAVPGENYFKLLDALADCGIIEQGYAHASKKKGATYLRLPWVKKGDMVEKPIAPTVKDPLWG